ncbi:hypothetical protein EFP19_03555 [Burkholderia glumae]|nr:hypothetical protein EFP19_03555 [Burkholderia glumae]
MNRLAGARAAPEGTHSITSPADHRPNRVGNFTSTLLGKLRPTLTLAALWQHDRLTDPALCQFGPVNVTPNELSGPVFGTSCNAVQLVWKRAVKGEDGFPNLRWHDLRHEAASRLFEKGLHPLEVASVTGHRSMQMLKRYTHLDPKSLLAKLG